jgi:hypothetical protein
MNGPQLEEEEFEIVSESPVSDTLIEILYGPNVRRVESAAQPASSDESAAVPAAPKAKSRYKSRYKPRPKRNPKQITAIARAPKSSIVSHPVPPSHAQPIPAPESPLERHQRKCVVCAHPDREAIEEDFLHWLSPNGIAYDYKFPASSLYRHAHATGLYTQRQGNLRSLLDHILDHASGATVTGDCIIRAVRAYTCLTPQNTWVEPASRVIFSTAPAPAPVSGELALSATEGPAIAPSASRTFLREALAEADGIGETQLTRTSHSPLVTALLIDTPAIRK